VNTHGLPHAPVEGTHGGIAYGEWPGTGSPLLCVHGISANVLGFLSLADALGPHRIVAPDLRGRGRSTQDGPLGLKSVLRLLDYYCVGALQNLTVDLHISQIGKRMHHDPFAAPGGAKPRWGEPPISEA